MNSDVNLGVEEQMAVDVTIEQFAKACKLKILSAEGISEIKMSTISVNRPGLILGGVDDYFARSRIQVMGNAEMNYLYKLSDVERDKTMERLFKMEIPCLVISRDLKPCKNMLEFACEYNCPILLSSKVTSEIVNDIINYLNDLLAPKISIHGVLIDIAGVGVMIMGKSGIGKSETALELIHRGHMLIADDAVELKRVKDDINGSSPEKIRDFMELRGVGIINVRSMYGVGGVLSDTKVDLVIELVEYDKTAYYDRTIDNKISCNIMGVEIPKLVIPVMMGRNLAIIVEVAAKNFRLQQMGCDANKELIERMTK